MKLNFKKKIDSQISKKVASFLSENNDKSVIYNLESLSKNHINNLPHNIFHKNIEFFSSNSKNFLKSGEKILENKQNNYDEIIDYSLLTNNESNNCLALTIKKDYKLTSLVNVAIRSCRMTFKVLVSYLALNIIKLFF